MYAKILAGIDLVPESDYVLSRAKKIAGQYSAELTVVTIVEMAMPPCYGGIYASVTIPDTIDTLKAQAQRELDKTLSRYDLPSTSGRVLCGRVADEILLLAKNSDTDLIVVGSHGRHGIRLLLGSTANSILHHAACDVLAVRMRED